MNKKTLLVVVIVGIVVIFGGVTALVVGLNKGSEKEGTQGGTVSSTKYEAAKACDLYTLSEAKEVLGENTEVGDNTPAVNSDDISVDTCTYTLPGATLADMKGTSVLVRSPLSKDGEESNKEGFESQRPSDATTVDGYGEAAYFNPQYGQLNIYADGVWYIINSGNSLRPDLSTIDDVTIVADKVL